MSFLHSLSHLGFECSVLTENVPSVYSSLSFCLSDTVQWLLSFFRSWYFCFCLFVSVYFSSVSFFLRFVIYFFLCLSVSYLSFLLSQLSAFFFLPLCVLLLLFVCLCKSVFWLSFLLVCFCLSVFSYLCPAVNHCLTVSIFSSQFGFLLFWCFCCLCVLCSAKLIPSRVLFFSFCTLLCFF